MTKKNAHNTNSHVSGVPPPHVPYSTLRYELWNRGGVRNSSGFGFGGGFGFGAESNKPLSVKSTRRPLNGILIVHPVHMHTYIRTYTTNGTDAKRFFIIFVFFIWTFYSAVSRRMETKHALHHHHSTSRTRNANLTPSTRTSAA